MLATILSAFRVHDIRKKLAFTALMLGLYRLGSHIPVPGVDVKAVNDVQEKFGGGGVLNLLNTFNWGNPETNFNAGTFGRITSMAGSGPNAFGPPATPRLMQFGVKYGF